MSTYFKVGFDTSELRQGANEALAQFRKISQAGNNATREFSVGSTAATRAMANAIRANLNGVESEILSITKKILDQRDVIKNVEADVSKRRLTWQNTTSASGKNEAWREYQASRKALDEEKAALFGLQQEQSRARVKQKEYNNELKRHEDQLRKNTSLASQFGGVLARFGGVYALASLGKQIIDVTGQFQMLNVAFKTILQSKEKATALMAQIVETAKTTPFQLTELATGAKQLVAYGFAAEEVNTTLLKLGNVAAALNLPLERMTYLYGTTRTQGRLYARDMLQFTTSGVPLLDELAKMYGKATQEVNKMVSAGKIGFPEVQRAFDQMTGKGGKFYNLMQESSKTVTGQISNLKDSFTIMLAELGGANTGIINGAVSGAKLLVDNYQTVGKIILELVAVYGIYKTAVIVASVANGTFMASGVGLARVITGLKASFASLNATMMSNPYIAIGAILASIVATMIIFRDRTTAQERAQKALNETLKEAKDYKEQMQTQSQNLINTIRSETSVAYEQVRAWDELIKKYKFFSKYSIEDLRKMSDKDLAKLLSEASTAGEDNIIQNKYAAQKKEVDRIKAEIASYNKKAASNSPSVSQNAQSNLLRLQGELEQAQSILRLTEKEINNINRLKEVARVQSLPEEQQQSYWAKEVENLKRLKNLTIADNSVSNPNKDAIIANLNERIAKAQKSLDSFREKDIIKNKQYWEKIQKDAQEELDLLGSEKSNPKEWGRLSGIIEKAKTEIAKYSVSKTTQPIIDQLDTLSEKTKQSQLELMQSNIDLMNEGKDKELAIIKQRTEEKVAAIEKEKNDLIAAARKAKKEVSKDDLAVFSQRESNVKSQGYNDKIAVERKYSDELKKIFSEATQYTLSEVEREKQGIIAKYDELVKRAKDAGATSAQIAQLIALQIGELDNVTASQAYKMSDLYIKAFGDISKYGYATIKDLRDKLNDSISSARTKKENGKDYVLIDVDTVDSEGNKVKKTVQLTIEEFNRLQDKVVEFNQGLANKNPFGDVASSVGELKDAIAAKDKEGLSDALGSLGSAFNNSISTIKGWGDSLGAIFGEEVAKDIDLITDLVGGIGNLSVGIGQLATGDIVGGITNVLKGVASIFTTLTQGSKQYKEDLKAYLAELKELQRDYAIAANEQMRTASEGLNIFINDYRSKINDAVRAAQDSIRLIQSSLSGNSLDKFLSDLQIKTGVAKKRFLGIVTGSKDVYGSLLQQYPGLIDASGNLNIELAKAIVQSGLLKESGKAALEELIAYSESYKEAVQAVKDNISDLVSSLGSSLYSAVNDAWLDGTDSATAFFDVVNKGLQDMVSQLVYNASFSSLFSNLQEQLVSVFTNSSLSTSDLTEQLASLFGSFYNNAKGNLDLYNQAMQYANDAAKKAGFDWAGINNTTRTGATKGIAQASQESVDTLGGLATTISEHTFLINNNTAELVAQSVKAVNHLARIEKNTDRLEAIENNIGALKQGVDNIILKGVKIQ